MATEYPPLGKSYVISYSNGDKNFPIIAIKKDPRVDNYRRPDDLSPHPDSTRYPNHVFTGTQPTNTDERVIWIYEILPSPWTPFTRYDDDLGPIQGRRRSVANTGQEATLERDKRVSYEAREGSAIVSTELEETWDAGSMDPDKPSPFPIKDRDFYDPSRGAVQERRQLVPTTGNEVATLENNNGIITQTSYEAYNEFLSFKIVQTYSVDGPQLVGNATNNEGQLVTVTTQRKASDNYTAPQPTATRTVEVTREDAESLVERIVDAPEIFDGKLLAKEATDPAPAKFRVAAPTTTEEETVGGQAQEPTLGDGDISKSEQQVTKFVKRIRSTFRNLLSLPKTLTQKATNNERQLVTVTETLQQGDTSETPTATKTIESESLGDGTYVVTKTEVGEVFGAEVYRKTKDDLTPQKFRGSQEESITEENIEGVASSNITLATGEFSKSEQQVNKFVKRVSKTSRTIDVTTSLSESILTPEGLRATRTLTLSNGSQAFTPSATLIDANVEALGDGRTVKTEVTIPKIFAGETFSVEKPDPLPQKFRVAAKTVTTQKTEQGTAKQPNLFGGEIAKSEQQVTEFIKRVSETSRDQTQLPVTLTQRSVDNDRQNVTVTETLQNTNPIEPNSATVTIQSEALGDGNFVVTRSEVPEVFSAESYQKTKADLTPQKFRATQEDLVFEETIEGNAEEPSLSEDEFAKTEQQVNKFVKRVSTTTRSTEETTQLSEEVLTPQGQIGTRTLTLSKTQQTIAPNAKLIDANVEALGDGRTVKTEVVVPDVFAAKTISKTKADLTPQKFRSAQEDTTIEETIEGTVEEPSLDENEFSKSEQQVTEFVKRVTTNVRDIETSTSLEESIVTPDGQLATRTLRLSKESQSIQPDALLVDGSIEALGDGRTIKTETKVPKVLELSTFSIERTDAIPAKFRVAIPTTTEQKTIEGEAELPSLEDGEISKSEQQQTKFVKRTIVTKRNQDQLPKTLTQKTTTNEGLLAVVSETLKNDDATEKPSATRTVESEALGDGSYVVRITETPKIFNGQTFSIEKPDIFPQKFRASLQSVTEQETIEGQAELPVLSSGEIAKSEQQITEFVKRTSKTLRDNNQLPVTLNQKATNQEKQLVTITETLQQGDTTEQPSSKIDIQSEAIGDGKYIVTKTQAPEVFKAKTLRAERADLTPQKFRSKQIDLTKEETIEGEVETNLTLGENQFLKSEQQINKFVKRVTTTERETEVTETLNEEVITPEGQLATRTITLSKGSQTLSPSSTVIDASIEELGDGRTIKTEVKVNEIFDGRQESLEKPEIIPPEFRASIQNKTVTEVKDGQSIILPSLSEEEVSKTIQRLTEHRIRETTVTRQSSDYPSLSGEFIDNDGIKVTREKTVNKGEQLITPSATVSGSVEALGDGYTLKTQDTKEEIFEGNQKTLTQSVQIPAKFFNETIEESFIEAGEDAIPEEVGEDGFGITQSSSQRISAFLRRQTKREQNGVTSLTEQQTNNFKQKVTISSSIVNDPSINPSSTTEFVRTQAIGGGKYLRETGVVAKVFDSKLFLSQKPDPIPEKFRVNTPVKRTEEVVEKTTAEDPQLGPEEYSKTEQRLSEFTVQKTTISRDDDFNETNNQRLEENWGIQIPYKEYIADAIPDGETIEADGLSDTKHLIREYDKSQIDLTLSSFGVAIPTSIDLDLPKVLKSVEVNWQEEQSTSIENFDTDPIQGSFRSLTQGDNGSVSSSISLVPSFEIKFEDIWGKNLPATIHLFFLEKKDLTDAEIRSKTGATQNWPVFKPQSFSTTVFGKSKAGQAEGSISRAIQINDTDAGYGFVSSKLDRIKFEDRLIPVSINIPPCLTEEIIINEPKQLSSNNGGPLFTSLQYPAFTIRTDDGATINLPEVSRIAYVNFTLNCDINFTIPATQGQTSIPKSGTYLISSSAEPYKFGWFLVRAITFDASVLD